MHPLLKELDDLYRPIQQHTLEKYHPSAESVRAMTQEELEQWVAKGSEASEVYNATVGKLRAIISSLSPAEIIEGFEQGCELLQASLCGYMCFHFDEMYIPTMIEAIRNDFEGGYHFLGALSSHTDIDLQPILLDALDRKPHRTRDTALAFIRELVLVEALPKVRAMIDDPDPVVASEAKQTLEVLERNVR